MPCSKEIQAVKAGISSYFLLYTVGAVKDSKREYFKPELNIGIEEQR